MKLNNSQNIRGRVYRGDLKATTGEKVFPEPPLPTNGTEFINIRAKSISEKGGGKKNH